VSPIASFAIDNALAVEGQGGRLSEDRQGERSTACDKLDSTDFVELAEVSRVELTPKSPQIQKSQ